MSVRARLVVLFVIPLSTLLLYLTYLHLRPSKITFPLTGLVKRDGEVKLIPLWVADVPSGRGDGFFLGVGWDTRPTPGYVPVSSEYHYKTRYGVMPGPHGEEAIIVDMRDRLKKKESNHDRSSR